MRWILGPVSVLFLAALVPVPCASQEPLDTRGAEKLGWRLALQTWTCNRMTFFEAVDVAVSIGVKYLEAYPGQRICKESQAKMVPGMTEADIDRIKARCKARGVRIVNFGVCPLPGKEAEARKVFQWAKTMGIETLCSEPDPAAVALLDRLAREFEINLAIHNHPKPTRYWNPDVVLAACKGGSKRVGACADTGHWTRSGLDTVACLKKLEGRIISFHFKDLSARKRKAHDVPWGTGVGNAEAMLAEMKRQGFKGVFSIEYEHRWDRATLKKCVRFFHAVAGKLAP